MKLFRYIKPILVALLLVAAMQASGLISAALFATQWALLQTGLRDATAEKTTPADQFDYQFTIKDLKGNKVRFDQFKGKVIFLNLWATWCGPCRAEMPGIQKLYEEVDKEKVTFILLSIDQESDTQKVSDYLQKNNFSFQAYRPSTYLPKQLHVPSIPSTFIISKDGLIIKKEVGSMRYNTPKFQKFLEDLGQ